MATNPASNFSADVVNYIAEKTLPLTQRQLVAYQFGDALTLPKNSGVTYQATRYNRIPLPFAPLSENVPPAGQAMTIAQVQATAQQWGDRVIVTDVAELTIKHPVFQKAIELTATQQSETYERNTFNALMGGTQVNYVNTRGSRAALVAGDTLDSTTVNRTVATLKTLGAPMYNGDERQEQKIAADKPTMASSDPRSMPHYVALIHPLISGDFSQASDVKLAWSYSDINRLYNAEAGTWRGMRFCESNMIQSFTGVAAVTGTAGTAGSLATASYFVQVTASDTQNQYESRIYQASGSISVTGPNGSISVTLPSIVGFTFSVYVGTTASPTNLGLTTSGPTSGPYAGQATQLTPGATVVITGVGAAQVPPAAPATGVTVFPTFVFGKGAYGIVTLDNVQFFYLRDADKSDPLNQNRQVGWKGMYGTLLQNVQFMARIESVGGFTATFG